MNKGETLDRQGFLEVILITVRLWSAFSIYL